MLEYGRRAITKVEGSFTFTAVNGLQLLLIIEVKILRNGNLVVEGFNIQITAKPRILRMQLGLAKMSPLGQNLGIL
jgi:hypothetical protein